MLNILEVNRDTDEEPNLKNSESSERTIVELVIRGESLQDLPCFMWRTT